MKTGKELNEEWDIGAKHVLAYKEGNWYHYLDRFPGAYCDENGYILFKTNKDYINSKYLIFGALVHVHGSISNMPGYIRVK